MCYAASTRLLGLFGLCGSAETHETIICGLRSRYGRPAACQSESGGIMPRRRRSPRQAPQGQHRRPGYVYTTRNGVTGYYADVAAATADAQTPGAEQAQQASNADTDQRWPRAQPVAPAEPMGDLDGNWRTGDRPPSPATDAVIYGSEPPPPLLPGGGSRAAAERLLGQRWAGRVPRERAGRGARCARRRWHEWERRCATARADGE